MLADVHTHLWQNQAASLSKAQSNSVGIVLAAAIDLTTSQNNIDLAKKFSQVKACIGIHPWRADLFTPEAEKALAAMVQTGKVTAISETGIDLVRRMADDFRTELPPFPLETQLKAFRAQVCLAVNSNLFLVFHDRGSTKEILNVFEEFTNQTIRGIVHGFSGTVDELQQYRQQGFIISINKRNLPAINPVVEILPLSEMVLETDSNDPAQVIDVCKAVAMLKKITASEVAKETTANLERLLGSNLI